MSNENNNPLDVQIGGDHYKNLAIQPMEFSFRNKIPAIEASVIKYVVRHKFKDGAKDVRKAIHFLECLLKLEYGEDYER